jgi:hypothetical protein
VPSLFSIFPEVYKLLALRPEEVAPILLRLALPQVQTGGFIPEAVTQMTTVEATQGRDYPFHKRPQVQTLISRAWIFAEKVGWIESAPGMNGRNGWRLPGRCVRAAERGDLRSAALPAAELPGELADGLALVEGAEPGV